MEGSIPSPPIHFEGFSPARMGRRFLLVWPIRVKEIRLQGQDNSRGIDGRPRRRLVNEERTHPLMTSGKDRKQFDPCGASAVMVDAKADNHRDLRESKAIRVGRNLSRVGRPTINRVERAGAKSSERAGSPGHVSNKADGAET